jgi:hypothetical protein
MSALGQKRTCAVQKGMSALPPKATSNATCGIAFGQKRTSRDGYERSGSKAAARGKVTLISVNSPGCVSTSIDPPCCFTMMS